MDLKIKGRKVRVKVPEGATKEQLDAIVEEIVRTEPPETFQTAPAASLKQPTIPTSTPPPVIPERRPVVSPTPPPTPRLTGPGPSFADRVRRPELPFPISIAKPAAADMGLEQRPIVTQQAAEEIARLEQSQADFDASLPGMRRRTEALRAEYDLESSPAGGLGGIPTGADLEAMLPGEDFAKRLAGFMVGQQLPGLSDEDRERFSKALGIPIGQPLGEGVVRSGLEGVSSGWEKWHEAYLSAMENKEGRDIVNLMPWYLGPVPNADELRKTAVGAGRMGFGALTAASPVVAPPLAGVIAASEAAHQIDPEGLGKVAEFAFSPIQSLTQPETEAGQEMAELADLATILFAGKKGVRKDLPTPKMEAGETVGATLLPSVRSRLAADRRMREKIKAETQKPGPQEKVSAQTSDGWERMNRGDFENVTDITPDVFSYLKGRGGKPVLAGRDGEALIGKSGLTHQDMVNKMTPEQGKEIAKGGTVSGRVSDKKDRIILWGDKKKSQKMTNFLFDLVQKGELKKDATVHFADSPKTFKLQDVIGGEFTDFGSTILPVSDMSISDAMQELKRLQRIPNLRQEERQRKRELQKKLSKESFKREDEQLREVGFDPNVDFGRPTLTPDVIYEAGGGRPFHFSDKNDLSVGSSGETHGDMGIARVDYDRRAGGAYAEGGGLVGRISDTGHRVAFWVDSGVMSPQKISEALFSMLHEELITKDARVHFTDGVEVALKDALKGNLKKHKDTFLGADLTGGLTRKAIEAGEKLTINDARRLWATFKGENEKAKQLASQRKSKEAHAAALKAQEVRETVEGFIMKEQGIDPNTTKAMRPQEIDKFLASKIDRGFRGGPDSAMPRGKTALDVVNYERKELGNEIQLKVSEDQLAGIPSRELEWISESKSYAKTFGKTQEVRGPFEILASDGEGGLLVRVKGSPKGFGEVRSEALTPVADAYVKKAKVGNRIQTDPVEVKVENARKIAEAYEGLPKLDRSPITVEAYTRLGKEVDAQFKELTKNVEVEWWTEDGTATGKPKAGQPYKDSAEMVKDVQSGKLKVFTGGEDHPFLGESTRDANAGGASLNDKLRAIHDAFGHAEKGLKFDSHGEENAWVEHSKMFSPLAQWALTSETRGQNSWVNYGKHLYNEKGERIQKGLADRPFADQKAALLPYELTKTGVPEIDAAKDAFMESAEFKRLEKQGEGLQVAKERLFDEGEFPEGYGEDVLQLYKSVEKELKKSGLQPMKKGDKRYTPEARIQRFTDVYEPAARDAAIKDQAEGGKMSKWYSSYRDHIETLTKNVDPDLAKPGSADLYAAMESIFSNGNPVSSEVNIASAEWAKFKKDGEFNTELPKGEGGWGPRGATMRPALDALNTLLEKFDGDHAKVAEWLKAKHPIEEVRAIKPSVAPEAGRGEPIHGAMVLGPKIGAYALNKMGVSDVVTLDSWMHRTWRAAMGQFSEKMGRTYDSDGNIQPQVQLNSAFVISERRMMTEGIKRLGQKLNLSPQEVQALLWGREREFAKRHGQTISESAPHAEFSRRRYEQKLAEGFGPEVRGDEVTGEGSERAGNREGDVGDLGGDRAEGTDFGASLVPTGSRRKKAQEVKKGPVFFSGLQRIVEQKMPNRASAEQVQAIIRDAKQAEVKWTGLDEFLETNKGKTLTKEEVTNFLKENEIKIEETTLGEPGKGQLKFTPAGMGDTNLLLTPEVKRAIEGAMGDDAARIRDPKEYARFILENDGDAYRSLPRDIQEMEGDWARHVINSVVDRWPEPGSATKFNRPGDTVLPGAKEGSYRELLLRLPVTGSEGKRWRVVEKGVGVDRWMLEVEGKPYDSYISKAEAEKAGRDIASGPRRAEFQEGHFAEEPNVFAHIRFNERTGPKGERILFVEEIQSDWAQKGRTEGVRKNIEDAERSDFSLRETDDGIFQVSFRGHEIPGVIRNPEPAIQRWINNPDRLRDALGEVDYESGVPDMPFMKNWHEVAFRRATRWAAENGYDRIDWTTGDTQNKRYDLSKKVDRIEYKLNDNGTVDYNVISVDSFTDLISKEGASKGEVAETVGKEVADRIFADEGISDESFGEGVKALMGEGLEIGGEGQKGFYDKILVDYANKFGKKWGARVEEGRIKSGKGKPEYEVWIGDNAGDIYQDGIASLAEAKEIAATLRGGRVRTVNKGASGREATHSLQITPEMRESVVSEGTPMFASILPTGDLLSEKAFEKLKKHAASVNVGRMNLSEKDQQKAKKYAETIQKEIERVTGETVTVEEVLEAAKDVDGWKKIIPRGEQVKVFAQINKLRQLVAQDIKKDRLSTKQAEERFLQLNNIANYAGRLLRFFREDTGGIEWGTKQQLYTRLQKMNFKLRDIQKKGKKVDWEDAGEVAKFYRGFVKPEAREVIEELRYISMLSSPRTHVVNAFSNLTQTVLTAPATRAVEAGVDWVRSVATNKQREVFASEVPAYYRAVTSSLPQAFSGAADAFTGKAGIQHLDIKRMPTAGESARGILKPISKLNEATGFVTRALEAGDVFFRTLVTEGERAALYERARQKGEKLTDKRMEAINEKAAEQGAYMVYRKALDPDNKTLQGDLLSTIDKATNSVYNLGNNVPGVRWVVPFVQTPMNIFKQGIEYSPLGFFTLKGAGKNRQTQFSKALVGSMVTAGTAIAISNLETTWEAPKGESERADFYAQGKLPFSIKFGDTWVQINRLGTMSYPIAIAMMAKHGAKDGKIGNIPAAMLQFFSEQSYMQGLKMFQEAIDEPERNFERFAVNVGKQVIPLNSLMRWANGFVDRANRVPDNMLEKLAADLPGFSKTMTQRATPYGEGATKPGLAENLFGLSPMQAREENKNPVVQELSKRGIKVGLPSRTIYDQKTPQSKYQEYVRRVGEIVMKELEGYRSQFRGMTDDALQDLVNQIVREVRRDVRSEMFEKERDQYEMQQQEEEQ